LAGERVTRQAALTVANATTLRANVGKAQFFGCQGSKNKIVHARVLVDG
jgi:hypothetical protein